MMLAAIIVGLSHKKNGLEYKPIIISQLHSMRKRGRGGFIANRHVPISLVFRVFLPVTPDLPGPGVRKSHEVTILTLVCPPVITSFDLLNVVVTTMLSSSCTFFSFFFYEWEHKANF